MVFNKQVNYFEDYLSKKWETQVKLNSNEFDWEYEGHVDQSSGYGIMAIFFPLVIIGLPVVYFTQSDSEDFYKAYQGISLGDSKPKLDRIMLGHPYKMITKYGVDMRHYLYDDEYASRTKFVCLKNGKVTCISF